MDRNVRVELSLGQKAGGLNVKAPIRSDTDLFFCQNWNIRHQIRIQPDRFYLKGQ